MLDEREVDAVEGLVRPLRAKAESDAVVRVEERKPEREDDAVDDDVLARPRPAAVDDAAADAENLVAGFVEVLLDEVDRVRGGIRGGGRDKGRISWVEEVEGVERVKCKGQS